MRFVLILVLALLANPVLGTTIVDFEDWTGDQYIVTSRGFSFAGNLSVSVDAETNNPTNALHSTSSSFKFKVAQPEAIPFTISSLDLQEGFGVYETVSVKLVGDSYSETPPTYVIQTFDLDGQKSTYETFYPIGFVDVDMVFAYAFGPQGSYSGIFSVDNIVVTPEPNSLSLMLFGVLGFWKRNKELIFLGEKS